MVRAMNEYTRKAIENAAVAQELVDDLDRLDRANPRDEAEIRRQAARARNRLKLAEVYALVAYDVLDDLEIPGEEHVHTRPGPTPLDISLRDERFGIVPRRRR